MTDGNKLELFNATILIVTNVLLNIILIPYMGLIGAAIATLISSIIVNILQGIQIYLRTRINFLQYDMIIWFITVMICLYMLGVGLIWGKVVAVFVIGVGIIYVSGIVNLVRKQLSGKI